MDHRSNRREFLKLGALATASFYSTPLISLAQDLVRPGPAKRIVIVGAGLAGLTAAYELVRAGHDVMVLIRQLLAPAQLRVGELWVSDTWSVAQEHAATAISEAVLTSLAVERELSTQPRMDAATVVVSCVEQEWHALPALMVTEHLRAQGYSVSYLGANVTQERG